MIEASSFAYCKSLTSITVPNTVTVINDRAFYYCDALSEVIIGSESSLYRINSSAFAYTAIESIYLPKNLSYFYTNSFQYCNNLTTLYCSSAYYLNNITSSSFAYATVIAVASDISVNSSYITSNFTVTGTVTYLDKEFIVYTMN